MEGKKIEFKEELKLCCEKVQEVMVSTFELHTQINNLISKNAEDPEFYEGLLKEDEEIKQMNAYLSDREVFLFGMLEIMEEFNRYCYKLAMENIEKEI